MKVNVLAIRPPKMESYKGEKLREVTPELLASSLAKYSRSNKGIDAILDTIDWDDPDASVDKIFKFVDYGHASIGGMTGGIPITIDECSMFLAYKIFEISSLVDGQESSTRYIKMNADSLMDPNDIGILEKHQAEWKNLMSSAFDYYNQFYDELDMVAQNHPELIRIPEGTPEKVANRMRKNYALDRARYYIPLATKTSAAYIMTARVWAEVIKQLDSYPIKECKDAAKKIREQVGKIAPRLMNHSYADDASIFHARRISTLAVTSIAYQGFPTDNAEDKVWVKVDDDFPSFMHQDRDMHFAQKENRYSTVGSKIRRTSVRFAFNNIAIAELRDLNRHRTGNRYTDLSPVGFYLPPELEYDRPQEFFDEWTEFMINTCQKQYAYENVTYMYSYLLGTQVAFEHTTQLDKFIYEIELRTGLGAHYRYAEHLGKAARLLISQRPEYERFVNIGTAEPE